MYLTIIRSKSLIDAPQKIKDIAKRLKIFKVNSMMCVDTSNIALCGMIKKLQPYSLTCASEKFFSKKKLHPPIKGYKKNKVGILKEDQLENLLERMKYYG